MERGELVPDDVVVAIIADRIGQPDARRGFVLDGFPRTVPQAQALDRLLAERGLKLDGVVELKVNEGILVKRIENRVAEMTARGEKLRSDDNADVLKGRLTAYRAQTAPLADYYAGKGMLKSVDGMAPIEEVSSAIGRILAAKPAGSGRRRPAGRKSVRRKAGSVRNGASCQSQGAKSPKTPANPLSREGRKGSIHSPPRPFRTPEIKWPSEVDENAMNPLISCTFRSLTRCRPPKKAGEGVVLRFALSPLRQRESAPINGLADNRRE